MHNSHFDIIPRSVRYSAELQVAICSLAEYWTLRTDEYIKIIIVHPKVHSLFFCYVSLNIASYLYGKQKRQSWEISCIIE